MASTYLTRTPSSQGNLQIATFSAWVKRASLGEQMILCTGSPDSSGSLFQIYFESIDTLHIETDSPSLATNRKFRDVSAWYHIVVAIDTTQSTSSDRIKLYINGIQETSFATEQYPSQNANLNFNKTNAHYIGTLLPPTYTAYYNGAMSHIHWIDGTAYDPTAFGETDATTGEWKIKTNVSVNYGTNGFFILKDGNSVTDQSGNGNNWSVGGGTLTKTEDCPSNVFATLNPLNVQTGTKANLSNGNTSVAGSTDGSIEFLGSSTLGMSAGKYYMEFKSTISSNVYTIIGITAKPSEDARNDHSIGMHNDAYGYYAHNGQYRHNNTGYSYGNSWNTNGDIVGIAVDLDNNKLYFSKNGVWQNSGDPTSGATGTGAISINDGEYFFGISDGSQSYVGAGDCNFGNGYFGTTAVSSAGTNASNNGIFEYDVPTGYTALSTKGLNE